MGARAVSAQPCEPYWSDEFPSAELDWAVFAMTVLDDGSGDGAALYIGGWFSTGGDVTLNRVARLDGNAWSALGSGMDGNVWALTGFDDGSGDGPALYAGGYFSNAGRVRVNNIARWNGSSWSPLGSGIDNVAVVRALAVFDDGSGDGPALYAGGYFEEAGGISANNIAKWDGSTWSPVASGVDGSVDALAVFDDGSGGGPALYAAGGFTIAGGVRANSVAKWDGKSWSPLGEGTDGTVTTLVVFDDSSGAGPALYAGGGFTTAGDLTVNRIAKWDGSTWSPLGSGIDGSVFALSVFDDGSGDGPALYAGGGFENAGGVTANRIAKWDGSSWSPLGYGMYGGVWALAAFDATSDDPGAPEALYAGGFFTQGGGDPDARYIAKWDGTTWLAVGGSGLTGSICPPANFYIACQVLSVFDDGSGPGPALYAGGIFCAAGGVTVKHIARWDGQIWSPVGGGVDGADVVVYALGVFDDGQGSAPALYAGGLFTTAGGVSASNIAKWDGTGWSPVGGGVSGLVYTLTVFDDGSGSGPALYAGGYVPTAGGVQVNHVAKWDGKTWSPLGSGLSGPAYVLTVFDDGSGTGPALYAAGLFTTAGGVSASNIAKWDGSSWSALGGGILGETYFLVRALTVYDDGTGPALYAGGRFTTAGGVRADGVAKWDGATWSAVGGGVGGAVAALAVFDDGLEERPALYAGGLFDTAGGTEANSIARWDGTSWAMLGEGVGGYQPTVWALTVFDDKSGDGPALFAGGEFTTAGGMSSQRIAKWIGCAGVVVGDLDGDGTVGITDLLILLGSWGACADCDTPAACPADLDGDCTVGILDLLTLLANWNAA